VAKRHELQNVAKRHAIRSGKAATLSYRNADVTLVSRNADVLLSFVYSLGNAFLFYSFKSKSFGQVGYLGIHLIPQTASLAVTL
jgi:hypothetical protein